MNERDSNTSWEQSADWYDEIIGADGSELYRKVVLPGALQLLNPGQGETILDLGCGQGVFSRALAAAGATVTGIDASPTLLKRAAQHPYAGKIRYEHRDAADLRDLGTFSAISAILCVQNMRHLPEVCLAAANVLPPGGRMVWVINHPCFRIPKHTGWDWDARNRIQFRRVDSYLTPLRIPIVMHPGKADSEHTWSYHLSLSDLFRDAMEAGFVLSGIEEWISPKNSQPGPRAEAENEARREIPLFMGLRWMKSGPALP